LLATTTLASSAWIFDNLTLTITYITCLLNGKESLLDTNYALPATLATSSGGIWVFRPFTAAGCAFCICCKIYFFIYSVVKFIFLSTPL
jgi:hypothetical protein